MPWQDRRTDATYKGVPLELLNYSIAGGKKGKDSDYANADGGGAEDLGAKQRKISVTGVIGGANYDADRERLEIALQDPGAGDLVLPQNPTASCLATSWSISEGGIEGAGTARYSITFVEITQPTLPTETPRIEACDLPSQEGIDEIGVALEGKRTSAVLKKIRETLQDLQTRASSLTDPAYLAVREIVNDTQAVLVQSRAGRTIRVDSSTEAISNRRSQYDQRRDRNPTGGVVGSSSDGTGPDTRIRGKDSRVHGNRITRERGHYSRERGLD